MWLFPRWSWHGLDGSQKGLGEVGTGIVGVKATRKRRLETTRAGKGPKARIFFCHNFTFFEPNHNRPSQRAADQSQKEYPGFKGRQPARFRSVAQQLQRMAESRAEHSS